MTLRLTASLTLRLPLLAVWLVMASLTGARSALASTITMSYSGRLTQPNGAPLEGTVPMEARFWSYGLDGTQLGPTLDFPAVDLINGLFIIDLVFSSNDAGAMFGGGGDEPVFIEITANGKVYPRQKFSYVPYALRIPVDEQTIKFGTDGKLTLAVGAASGTNQFLTKDGSGKLTWGTPQVTKLQNQTISAATPSSGQVLKYDGTQWVAANVATSANSFTGVLPVASGGTGLGTLSGNSVLLGNGTDPVQAVSPGASGNVLTSNGSTWQSAAIPATNWASPGAIGSTTPNTGSFTTMTASGNVGIGTTSPAALLSAGSFSQFQVNSSGDLVSVRGVSYSWPTAQGTANQVLTNNGSGSLSWTTSSVVSSQWANSASDIYYTSGNVGIGTATSNSTLQVAGSLSTPTVSKTTSYTLTATDNVVIANAASGSIKMTLPDAVGINGRQYTIKKSDVTTNLVVIGTTANETIDGQSSTALTMPGRMVTLASDGANWKVINGSIVSYAYCSGGESASCTATCPAGTYITAYDMRRGAAACNNLPTGQWGVGGSCSGMNLASCIGQASCTTPNWYSICSDTCSGHGKTAFLIVSCSATPNDLGFGTNAGSYAYYLGGNVGIATSAPGYKLDVATSGTGLKAAQRLQNNVTAAANSGAQTIYAANRTTSGLTDVAGIGGIITDITQSAYKGALILSTANNAAPVERMRIDSSGNVGIGITSPAAALDINGQIKIQGGTPGAGKVLTSDANGLASWSTGVVGSITGVTAGNGLTGGGTSGSVTLNADVGTTANKLVQLDASAKLPPVDGSALTNLNPASLSSEVSVAKGGTGLTSGTSGGIPYFNAASTMASSVALTANGVVLGGGAGAAPTATAAGAANTVLRVPSGGGAPSFGALDVSQSSAVTGTLNLGNGGTGTSLLVTGGTGQYLKQTASGAAVSVDTIAAADLPTMVGDSGSGGTKGAVPAPASGDSAAGKFLKADGSWSVPSSTTNWAAPGTIGSTTPNSGAFTTLTASGNVGIGTTAPNAKLQVASGQVAIDIPSTLTPTGTTQTIDWNNGNVQILSLASASGNVTLTLNNPVAGATYAIKVIQHATAAKSLVWPAAAKWPGGTAPTVSTGASAVDLITLYYDGSVYLGDQGKDYK